MHQVLFSLLSLYGRYMFGWFYLFKAWNIWCACMGLVRGLNMMSLVCIWYEIWNGSWMRKWWILGMILVCDLNEMVVIKVAWYWYERKLYIHGLGRMSWYGFHMWSEWGMVIKVGMRFLCMIYITAYLNMIGLWLVRNSMGL